MCLFLLHMALRVTPNSFVRVVMLRCIGASIGSSTFISSKARFEFPWRLNIGNNSYIGEGVLLDCRGGTIYIGDSADISEGAMIYTLSHDIYSKTFAVKGGDIHIGDRSWVCAGVKLLPNSAVGNGCVVGANSVLSGDATAFGLYVGIPALFVQKLPIDRAINVRTPS